MSGITNDLKNIIKGDVEANEETLAKYSKDASLFEVRPKVVVFPKDTEDVKMARTSLLPRAPEEPT